MRKGTKAENAQKKIACSLWKGIRLLNTRKRECPCCVRTKYTAIGAFLQEENEGV